MDDSSGKINRRVALKNIASATLGAGAVLSTGSRAESESEPIRHRAGWKPEPPNPANLPPNRPAWMMTPGRGLTGYGSPSPYEKSVLRVPTTVTAIDFASWNFTPLQHLHGIVTPSGLHFERNHGGVPDIDPSQHRLLIEGMVKRPLLLTMDELMRYPTVSQMHFIECSGNTSKEWRKPTGKTVQQTHGLLSCSEWTGVRLSTVLDDVGVDPKATWALAEGADAAAMDRSIPVRKLFDDAILAFAQNGEMLRPSQGYPLRLLVPGYEGNMNIKWLRRLKFGTAPSETYEETAYYTELMKDGRAKQFNFVMQAKSVITYPSGDMQLDGPGYYEISGFAWSGEGKIRRVDVSTDGGRTWHRAQLQEPVLTKCLTRFRFDWVWDGSPAVLQSRCVDETGYEQPTIKSIIAARGLNSNYHLNGIQSWKVDRNGGVTNVHV
ncbi:sulfite dehydrogenase [Pandoraea terrae]|uniref:Sulfite dehydrogenase n=1 Tax=Pandoraea terrae TaxID=1537710 RepID=A0A5E4V9L2_9BURK|nr:sulfite dehydrogenase [Pandoraea terrae]VVE08967.1 sulfite dehydrogenase [Pandoraea terrae]